MKPALIFPLIFLLRLGLLMLNVFTFSLFAVGVLLFAVAFAVRGLFSRA